MGTLARDIKPVEITEMLGDEGLMAPDDMAELLMDYRQYIIGERMDSESKKLTPRFGLLSLKGRSTPIYAYGHPALCERFPTSFSDGVHVYVNANFMRVLVEEEEASGGAVEGVVPLLLHSLSHLVLRHHKRFLGFPRRVADVGSDVAVNCKLRMAYPDMKWAPSLLAVSPGASMSRLKTERYAKLAEETIMHEIMAAALDKDETDDEESPQDGSPDEKGNDDGPGEEGSPGEGSGKPSPRAAMKLSGESVSEALDELGFGGVAAGQSDDSAHTIPLEQFSELLDELGIESTKEVLDIPEADDAEKIAEIEKDILLKDINDIQKASRLPGAKGIGKGNLEGDAYEMVQKMTDGKINWRLGIQQLVLGDGMNFAYQEETPGDLYYVDPSDMSLSSSVYIGEEVPMKNEQTVAVLVDTSGSVGEDELDSFFSELVSLVKSSNPGSEQATKVVLLMADVGVRYKPIELTEQNVDEFREQGFKAFGRGGTDIAGSLRQVAKMDFMKEEKVRAIVYFTDLLDSPPKATDVPEGCALAFVCPPDSMGQHEFIRGVRDFAKVFAIEDDAEVDLSPESLPRRMGP